MCSSLALVITWNLDLGTILVFKGGGESCMTSHSKIGLPEEVNFDPAGTAGWLMGGRGGGPSLCKGLGGVKRHRHMLAAQ